MSAVDALPLTAAQRDIWLDQIGHGDSPLYNIGGYVELTGPLNPALLQQALEQLVAAHDGLRTQLIPGAGEGGLPLQTFAAQLPVALPVHDLRGHPQPTATALAMISAQMRKPYVLEGGPLWRFSLICLGPDHHWLVTEAHHLILDGWGFGHMLKALGDHYTALTQGGCVASPAPSYGEFVVDDRRYQGSPRHALDRAYWLDKYRDLPEPLLAPRYHNRRATDPAPSHTCVQAFPAALHVRMQQFAERCGASAFHVLLAALHVYFTRTAQRDDWVVGLPLLNRGGARFKTTLGHFAQISAVRLGFAQDMDFEHLVLAVRDTLKRDFRHQRLPLDELNRSLGLSREARAQLFEVSLSYEQDDHDYRYGEARAHTVKVSNGHEATPLAIHLRTNRYNDKAWLHLVHHRAWFDTAEVQALAERLVHVLEQGLERPTLALTDFELRTAAEQHHLQQWNDTTVAFADAPLIHRRIEAQAALHPDAIAALHDGQPLSYGQLNRRANGLAEQLIAMGVRPEDRVAVVARRSLDTLAGLLACLKAGAAYVPIDPAQPHERLAYLLADSAPVVVLTQAALVERLPTLRQPLVVLDRDQGRQDVDRNPAVPGLTRHALVYVIYTSGSTGQPKGVMVEHHTLANLVDWHCQAFSLVAGDQVSCLAGFGFDAMAWEVWPTLCAGATLHLAPVQEGGEDLDTLLRWWRAQPLDISFLPTPVAEYAFGLAWEHPTLRTLLIGGDRLRQFSRDRRYAVINNYGPTEATVVATSGAVSAGGSLHIGGPIANTRVHVLDARRQAVPPGVTGELYIGGAGVARGYLNRAQLTQERFVADPFSDDPKARLYRTGDLVRWNPDGTLDYLGRNDDQVKIRGMRIELGEIEAVLASHPAIKDAVVLVRDQHLLAWYTEWSPVPPSALREALRAQLPGYMVPRALMRLGALPLTQNGKLDRRRLPDPDPAALAARDYQAPQGAVETAMAAIWAHVLGVERVGRHDNFFELGGHSLLAVNLVAQLRKAGLAADVQVLLGQPTVAALAACEADGGALSVPPNRVPMGCTRITPDMLSLTQLDQTAIDRIVAKVPGGAANVQEIYPLAPLQEGIVYHHLSAEHGDPYLLQWRLAFDSPARLQAWAAALQQVIDRHDILRSAVVWEGLERPQQVVWRQATLPVEAIELPAGDAPVIERLQQRFDARRHRLDLGQAPLLRLVHADDPAQGEVAAVLLFHHLVLDNTAMALVAGELQALLEPGQAPLAPPVPYRHYVAHVCLDRDQASHDAFFRAMLGDIDEPTLPLQQHDVRGEGHDIEEVRQGLDADLALRLREQARQLGVSAASLLHVAWARVLAVLAGRRDLVFGTVLMGRLRGGEGADQALGVFINTLPLRVDTDLSVREAVKAVHGRLTALLTHEQASLAQALRCSGLPAGAPLFSALLNYRHSAGVQAVQWPGVRVMGGEVRSNYPLTLSVDDLGAGFDLQVLAAPGMGAERICGWVQATLAHLVVALQQARPVALADLPLLTAPQQRHLLHDFNATAQSFATGHTVHALVQAQVVRTPDAPALVQGERVLTYAALNQQANRLAHYLIGLGIQPGDLVALCLQRGPARVAGLLAVLKAGAAYVPIDPGYPQERIAYLVQDSAPRLVLTDAASSARVGTARQVNLDRDAWYAEADTNPDVPGIQASDLAYVVYTSGSTGQPKGVMVEHGTLANLVHWHCQAFALGAGSHTSSVAGFGFDAMAWETWPALCAGAVLHLPPAAIGNEHVDELLDWWLQQPLAVSFLPTPVAEQALGRPHQHPTLRCLLIGGDRLRQFDRDPGFAVINNYGPTETTVVATSGALRVGGALDIGRPIANTCVYVLDAQRQLVPQGVAGELYIGGAGVARGYLNRPQLTQERFVADPFSERPGARLYRSGDLVRWNPDGTLDYLGRNDDQVKIRGMRIEPGEIEAALTAQPGVREAVVLVRGDRLLAWFVADGPQAIEPLREALRERLPGYMVPLALLQLPNLPLTPHGKLDRRALPDPDPTALASRPFEAPQGPLEQAMAAIWAQVLGLERVGRHDNFFELGGHSLLAVALVERLRMAGLGVDVRVLLGQPSVAALAASVGSDREVAVPANRVPTGCVRITPDLLSLTQLDQAAIDGIVAAVPGGAANVQEIYPLAPLQEGILYHYLTAEGHDPYLLHLRLHFDSPLRLQAVAAALQGIIARHDSLRTAIAWQGLQMPQQVVWRSAPLPVEQVVDAAATQVTQIDLGQAPLMRLVYCVEQDGTVAATLLFHHIVLDATSLDVVREELLAALEGVPGDPRPPVPYRHYVAQARLAGREAEHEAYFRAQLGDVDEPTLAFGVRHLQGHVQQAQQPVPPALTRALRSQARQLGVSVASLMHLAWARVLAAATGQQRVVFGTVLLGRLQAGAGADRGLGMFINTLPLRVDLAGVGVRDGARATHGRLAALLAHEHASLAQAQRCSGVPAPLPLFSTILNYRHAQAQARQDARENAWEGVQVEPCATHSNYPLSLDIDDLGDDLRLIVSAPAEVGATRVVGYVLQSLEALAAALHTQPDLPLLHLPVLPPSERQQVLQAFNASDRPVDARQTLHGLFEARAAATPQAIAVRDEHGELSYRQLNDQANRLAHHLIEQGVRADDRVAICVERGLPMVVGLLAILKAGGAYVPLDPGYPLERLRGMLADSAPVAMLVQASTRDLLGSAAVAQVDLADDVWQHQSTLNPQVDGLAPHHLAYVMYTSGSTGTPKGVMVEHRNVVNLVQWACDLCPVGSDGALLHKTPLSFDASVWELFWPLCAGLPLVLARPDGQRDPAYLARLIQHQRISVVQFVPVLLQQFLDLEDSAACTSLTDIVCGGGELTHALACQVRQRLPGVRLHNVYGPTETTVDCSVWSLAPDQPVPAGTLPIGRPIANTRLYVLDSGDQPVPLGVVGHLHIGGAGVARGYRSLPAADAERFIASPFNAGERLYRSGDLVRQRADGLLEFMGRNDDQIKVNGLRIEPGDIQACLLRQPGIEQAVVMARDDLPGGQRLVAYYSGAPVPVDTLRHEVASQVPDYMVPALFVHLHTWPLSPNGKLDRQALPIPGADAVLARAFAAPQGDTEALLARLWAELLGLERVGRHDNFFELGGHSLLAVSLTARLRQEGLEADVRALFEHPTLAAYAAITESMEITL